MSDLEAVLRKLAAAGELTYLSIVPIAGKGSHGVIFSATYSPARECGHGFGRHADPVEAIKMAVRNNRLGKRKAKTFDSTPPKEPWDV